MCCLTLSFAVGAPFLAPQRFICTPAAALAAGFVPRANGRLRKSFGHWRRAPLRPSLQ